MKGLRYNMMKVDESMFPIFEREAMQAATSAANLRKKGGCSWCRIAEKHHLRFECVQVDNDGHIAEQAARTLIADFCPKCGRFLSHQFKWAAEAD